MISASELGGGRIFTSRRSAGLAEASAVLAVIALTDAAAIFPVKLTQLQPHPFWIPVLLAACIHGRAVGYVVVFAAVLADLALNWPEMAKYSDFYDFLTASSVNAAMWLAAALVFGSIREAHLKRLAETEQLGTQRASEAKILAERCSLLIREVSSLENEIAAAGAPAAGKVLNLFEHLLKLPAEKVLASYAQALNQLIGAEGIVFHELADSRWCQAYPKASHPESDGLEDEAVRICKAVGAGDRVYNCVRDLDLKVLNGHAALAAPIRASDGELMGVVTIREADAGCLIRAGESALLLGNFILGARLQKPGLPALGSEASYKSQQRQRPMLTAAAIEAANGRAAP